MNRLRKDGVSTHAHLKQGTSSITRFMFIRNKESSHFALRTSKLREGLDEKQK